MPTKFSKELQDLLTPPNGGSFFGDVQPRREVLPLPPLVDGRTAGLRTLRKYLQEIVFYRAGGRDKSSGAELPPIAFRLPERDVHVEWPDSPENVNLPALAFLSTEPAQLDSIGMTPHVDEGSEDEHAPGTVLVWLYEHTEYFNIEVWAETKAQRRALVIGLEQAFSPLDYMCGLRFKMPDYYGQLVAFSLETKELVDDELATKNRRRARFRVLMRFHVVALYPVSKLEPSTRLDVDE